MSEHVTITLRRANAVALLSYAPTTEYLASEPDNPHFNAALELKLALEDALDD